MIWHNECEFSDSASKRSHNLHEAYQLPCVQWMTPDEGHRRCPKHVGGTEFQPDSASKRSHNLHEAYQLPCVQWMTPDEGHRRCPKHVGFYDKDKLWILTHLVAYCHETYHDARSPEYNIRSYVAFAVTFTVHQACWKVLPSGDRKLNEKSNNIFRCL